MSHSLKSWISYQLSKLPRSIVLVGFLDKTWKFKFINLQNSFRFLANKVDESRGQRGKNSFSNVSSMDWDFSEDEAFLALCDAFRESGETSAMEFLATGEGAFHFQEITQNAAGEGIDLSDSESMAEFQMEVLEAIDEMSKWI